MQEEDWKRFRAMVPELRELYLRDRNAELMAMFQSETLTASERFWAVHERMEEIVEILRCCLDDHRKSNVIMKMSLMYRHQLITEADLQGFGEDLRERISAFVDIA